jgi:hypothetical protein
MLLITSLLQEMPQNVTTRMGCAHTLAILAHRIYLMTAKQSTTAHSRQTNAAAGKNLAMN